MVGATRFELVTFCTPSKRATSLRYAPTGIPAKLSAVYHALPPPSIPLHAFSRKRTRRCRRARSTTRAMCLHTPNPFFAKSGQSHVFPQPSSVRNSTQVGRGGKGRGWGPRAPGTSHFPRPSRRHLPIPEHARPLPPLAHLHLLQLPPLLPYRPHLLVRRRPARPLDRRQRIAPFPCHAPQTSRALSPPVNAFLRIVQSALPSAPSMFCQMATGPPLSPQKPAGNL